ncbi:MAG: hypothetical protein V8Q83_09295 [Blautia sp.]
MSLVGTRRPTVEEVAQYEERHIYPVLASVVIERFFICGGWKCILLEKLEMLFEIIVEIYFKGQRFIYFYVLTKIFTPAYIFWRV